MTERAEPMTEEVERVLREKLDDPTFEYARSEVRAIFASLDVEREVIELLVALQAP